MFEFSIRGVLFWSHGSYHLKIWCKDCVPSQPTPRRLFKCNNDNEQSMYYCLATLGFYFWALSGCIVHSSSHGAMVPPPRWRAREILERYCGYVFCSMPAAAPHRIQKMVCIFFATSPKRRNLFRKHNAQKGCPQLLVRGLE